MVVKSMRTQTNFVPQLSGPCIPCLWLGRGHPVPFGNISRGQREKSLSVWKAITSPFVDADHTHKGFYF